ncbi:MAG: hypothetical protein MUC60_01025 [Oscillatoria sp. Prado101]|nr:hypothetical protein [Oscillatoria sp. Prado101]
MPALPTSAPERPCAGSADFPLGAALAPPACKRRSGALPTGTARPVELPVVSCQLYFYVVIW